MNHPLITNMLRDKEGVPDEVRLSRMHSWRGARVYFIQAGNGPVKIGWSYNPESRRRMLQTASPEPLVILSTMRGGPRHEAYLHEFYADEHIHGEWFQPSDRLLDYVSRCKRVENL